MMALVVPTLSLNQTASAALADASKDIREQLCEQGFRVLEAEFVRGQFRFDALREGFLNTVVIDLFGRRVLQDQQEGANI